MSPESLAIIGTIITVGSLIVKTTTNIVSKQTHLDTRLSMFEALSDERMRTLQMHLDRQDEKLETLAKQIHELLVKTANK